MNAAAPHEVARFLWAHAPRHLTARVTEPLYRDRIAAPLDIEKDPWFHSQLFYTLTNEVAPFRVVENDYGLSVDRLTYFGCMFFARLRATAGIRLARHEFPGEWVVVEEGCMEGVLPSHFDTARKKSGQHHLFVSLGFGSQEACAAAVVGPARGGPR